MAEESDAALPNAPSLRRENHPRNVSHARSRLDTTAIKVNRARRDDVVRARRRIVRAHLLFFIIASSRLSLRI